MSVNWLDAPLESFTLQYEFNEAGLTTGRTYYPHGEGQAQSIVRSLWYEVTNSYERLIPYETDEKGNLLEGYPEALCWERAGEVPVIRDGVRGYEALDDLTLSDLPIVLDTLTILEKEQRQREQAESERKAAARKNRKRVLAKERRKLKALEEW